jgi:hypothetical protein
MNATSKTWRISFEDHGRDGHVRYHEGGTTLSFYREFGGGDVVFSIAVGDAAEWRAQYPGFADRREEIIARVAAETIRAQAPNCRWSLDATGRFIHFSINPDAPRPAGEQRAQKQADAAAMVWRLNEVKSRMSVIVLVLMLLGGAALLAGRPALTVKTTGTPIGASARAGEYIATPVGRLEPYVLSLNRDHSRDTYSIGLLIHSARDEKFRRYVEAAKGRSGSTFGVVKITGVSDDLIFFDAPDGVIIDARKAQLLSADEAARPKRSTRAWRFLTPRSCAPRRTAPPFRSTGATFSPSTGRGPIGRARSSPPG